ncbi:MAG: type IV toxin-antitoxin system AbiEi family antitoxin domain-containing protein [Solirubrobacterales bacterium]
MGGEATATRDRLTWQLVHRQHGVVTRRQLLRSGFTAKAIEHRITTGRLHRIHPGVYAVGRRQLTQRGRWMAAVLACGPDAVLSHGSAAALWGIGPEWKLVELSVRRRVWPTHEGIKVRSRPSLPSQDLTSHDRVPLTTPPRTILDQAALPISDASLERLVNEADAHKGIELDPESLRRYVSLRPGEPGAPRLRAILDPETFRLSDSELERLFRPIALAAGLPQPLTKAFVNEYEVDFFWPDLGLIVETDSLRYHRTALKQSRDLLRDQVHTASGFTPLRFTHWQVAHEPRHVTEVLRATLSLLRGPPPQDWGGD